MTVIIGGRANDRDVVTLLERWAEWRHSRTHEGLGWPRNTILGRILDGMPSTKCIACQGSGRVAGHRIGAAIAFVQCALCNGNGKIKADPDPCCVNPAFIRSTATCNEVTDDASERLDRIVASMGSNDSTRSLYFVIYFQYTRQGMQAHKAQRMGISGGYYSKLLERAHTHIRERLTRSGNKY